MPFWLTKPNSWLQRNSVGISNWGRFGGCINRVARQPLNATIGNLNSDLPMFGKEDETDHAIAQGHTPPHSYGE